MELASAWLCGGIANALASTMLHPLDIVKTRMQILATNGSSNRGMSQTFITIYRRKGLRGLWIPGLTASCTREMLSSGPRAGFYVPVRDGLCQASGRRTDDSLVKVISALFCGSLGALIGNPADVLKIRYMADPHAYPSLWGGVRELLREEGVSGLYRGLLPCTLRAACIAAGELATYDIVKTRLCRHLRVRTDDPAVHVLSSLVTGVVAAFVAAPFDLLKARAMHQHTPFHMSSAVRDILRHEGLPALYRGVLPAYLRLGPHALLCFPVLEQLRSLVGLDHI